MMQRLIRGGCAASFVLLSSCTYHPGSFRDWTGSWPQTRASTKCLDISLARRDRAETADSVIEYRIGNRCEQRVTVDLASVRAIGRDAPGNDRPLVAYDPRHELRPVPLNALWTGKAEIAYRADGDTATSVCLDISHVDPADLREPRWMCLPKEAP